MHGCHTCREGHNICSGVQHGRQKEKLTTGTKLNMLAANRKGPMTCPTMLLVDRDGWGKAFRRTVQSDKACPAREYCRRAISLSVATWRGRLKRFRLSWYLPLKNLGCKSTHRTELTPNALHTCMTKQRHFTFQNEEVQKANVGAGGALSIEGVISAVLSRRVLKDHQASQLCSLLSKYMQESQLTSQ